MSGTLYLVATPIGNLGDMSERGIQTLRDADFIAAEDTRVTGKLLNRFEIKKPSVSYHEHNKRASGEAILRRLLAGENCALVTDAGMPASSDPGEDLVRLCAENGIPVIAVPGCCAAVTALAVSGLPSRRFCFEGFLPMEKRERTERLEALKTEKRAKFIYTIPNFQNPSGVTMSEEKRHYMTDTLFDILSAANPRTLQDLTRDKSALLKSAAALVKLPPEDRKEMWEIAKTFVYCLYQGSGYAIKTRLDEMNKKAEELLGRKEE